MKTDTLPCPAFPQPDDTLPQVPALRAWPDEAPTDPEIQIDLLSGEDD